MQKQKKFIIFAYATLCSVAVCLVAGSATYHFSKTSLGENIYNNVFNFCLDQSTGDEYTNSSGYIVKLKTNSGTKGDNNFRTLSTGGSVAIVDGYENKQTKGINGLTSICVNFTSGNLSLSYGWKDGIYYASNIPLTNGVSYDFNGDKPNYFRIDNVSDSEASNIVSVIGTCSCEKTEEKKQSESDWTYTLSDNKVTLTSYVGSQNYINVPNKINGYDVVSINSSCFSGVIENTKGIYIPSSVTTLPGNLFSGANKIEKVSFPFLGSDKDTGKSIDYFFNNSIPASLTNVEIRGGVLKKEAFKVTSSITDVTLFGGENGISSFHVNAFWGCCTVNNINIVEGTLKDIDSQLQCFSKDGIIYTDNNDKYKIVCFPKGRTGDYIIDSNVDTVVSGSFRNCNISSITFHENISSIGAASFDDCPNLSAFIVSENNPKYSNDSYGVLFNKKKTELITYPSGKPACPYQVPDGVTKISKDAFAFSNVTEVTFVETSSYESTVTTYSDYAFYNCLSLTRIIISKGIKNIGKRCFGNCNSKITTICFRNSETECESISKGEYWNGSRCPIEYDYKDN